jgi:tetratricopeptide (TPR) repeat protein
MSTSQTARRPADRTGGAGPGRNDPCPCGSGRKFKQCCAIAPAARAATAAPAAATLDPLKMKAGRALTPAGDLTGNFSPLQRVLRLGPSTAPVEPVAPPETTQAAEQSAAAYVNLARGYRAAGRLGDAIQAWRQATRLDPGNHATWHDLGGALMQAGRLPDAIGAFRRAIAAKRDFVPSQHMLGVALEAQGNEIQALGALQRAVALSPKLADAHARIGTLSLGMSRREEAIAALRRAAAAAPQADIGRLSLAKAFMAEERQEEAEAVLRKMLARSPTHFDARKMLGDVLSFGGKFAEAGQEYQRAISTGQQPISAYHSLVSSRKLTEADRPIVEGMQRLLARGRWPDFSLMILHFSLGKALDDLKDYEAAMQHFDAANRLRHRTAKLDRPRLVEQFDMLMDRFTPEYFASHAELGTDDETPLLVLGMPRSGTTLTEQIISSHPAVVGGGELPYWLEAGPPWDAGKARSLTVENARRVAEDYLTLLRGLGPDAARVTDKMPPNFMWIGLIHMLFPKARIIHCKRNPIDICLSIYSTYFTARMDFAADRGDLVFFYRQYERLMAHWREVLPPAVYYETVYEDLVGDREVRSRELIDFCGLDWDDACLVPEQNERQVRTASVWQARQPVYKTPVARWRRYEPWLGELRELVAE